jgi:hypothetical protein
VIATNNHYADQRNRELIDAVKQQPKGRSQRRDEYDDEDEDEEDNRRTRRQRR